MSPICYHKMCESCVDRIFTQGPAPCPVIGCGKTLRKNKFRKQTFEDVTVEREVDVRKRIAKTFNKRRDDFETLLDYNNYLEEVEEMTFNLVNGVDVAKTESKLQAYELANKDLINTNAARQAAEMQAFAQATEAEKEAHRLAREMAARELEEERREQEEMKKMTLNALAKGDKNAVKIIQDVQLKSSSERKRRQAEEQMRMKLLSEGMRLKRSLLSGTRKKEVEEGPFDPLGGLDDRSEHYVVQDHYESRYVVILPPSWALLLTAPTAGWIMHGTTWLHRLADTLWASTVDGRCLRPFQGLRFLSMKTRRRRTGRGRPRL